MGTRSIRRGLIIGACVPLRRAVINAENYFLSRLPCFPVCNGSHGQFPGRVPAKRVTSSLVRRPSDGAPSSSSFCLCVRFEGRNGKRETCETDQCSHCSRRRKMTDARDTSGWTRAFMRGQLSPVRIEPEINIVVKFV